MTKTDNAVTSTSNQKKAKPAIKELKKNIKVRDAALGRVKDAAEDARADVISREIKGLWVQLVLGQLDPEKTVAAFLAIAIDTREKDLVREECEELDAFTHEHEDLLQILAKGEEVPCYRAVEIIAKWSTMESPPATSFENEADIPTTLDDLEWPIEEDILPYVLEIIDRHWCLVKLIGKVRYVEQKDGAKIEFYAKTDFISAFDNREYLVRQGQTYLVSKVAKLWMTHPKRRGYEGVTFCPGCQDDDYSGLLNLFTGFGVETQEGDWSLLKAHILDNVCRGDEFNCKWLMTWMAQLVQEPTNKMGSAVVLRGKKGTGKSFLADWLRKLLGDHAIRATQSRHVTGNFNAHMATCLLLVAEEAFWAGDKQAEAVLKSLITDSTVVLERKGIDPVPMDNYTRVFVATNADWAVPATADERRFFVLEISDAKMKDKEYFGAIDKQMKSGGGAEAMLHDLLHYDLEKAYEDGVDLRNPPKTKALQKQVYEGLEKFDQWWMDTLINGGFYGEMNEFVELQMAAQTELLKKDVSASARAAMQGQWNDNALTSQVAKNLKKYVPDLKSIKRAEGAHTSKRVPRFVFPPLREMWKDFEERTGILLSDYDLPENVVLVDPAPRPEATITALKDKRAPEEKQLSEANVDKSAAGYRLQQARQDAEARTLKAEKAKKAAETAKNWAEEAKKEVKEEENALADAKKRAGQLEKTA